MLTRLSTKEEISSAFETYGTKTCLESYPNLLNNKAFMLLAAEVDGFSLLYASYFLRKDTELVYAAIKQTNGWAYFYMPKAIRENQDIKFFTRQFFIYGGFHNLRPENYDNSMVINDLINAEEMSMEKAQLLFLLDNPLALMDISGPIRHCKVIIMALVQKNGLVLKYASPWLQDNLKIVTAAIKQNGLALQFASNRLQDNYIIVLTAVKQNGNALDFASRYLQTNLTLLGLASENSGVGGWFFYGVKSTYYDFFVNDPYREIRDIVDLTVYNAADKLSNEIQDRKIFLNNGLIKVNKGIKKTNDTQLQIDESLEQTVMTINETNNESERLKESLEITSKQLDSISILMGEKDQDLYQLKEALLETQLALSRKEVDLEESVSALQESKIRFDEQLERLKESERSVEILSIEKEKAAGLANQMINQNNLLKDEIMQHKIRINHANTTIEMLTNNFKIIKEENKKLKEDTTKLRGNEEYLNNKIHELITNQTMLLMPPKNPNVKLNATNIKTPLKNENSSTFFSPKGL